ncbi:hypothetical protein IEQ34_026951 [Dendrobium chrysotoxum]|uniref:Uncharacterized protein n=1 Tax=Dendrobium chrysotoxum TaxID=161865 RepID=A0AAV7FIF9_DENCH|nr:hypothetical protein IEQ34_026951 [Dendrobium chrysotoxum]
MPLSDQQRVKTFKLTDPSPEDSPPWELTRRRRYLYLLVYLKMLSWKLTMMKLELCPWRL